MLDASAALAWALLWHEEVADVLLRRRRAKRISARDLDLALQVFNGLILETQLDPCTLPLLIERWIGKSIRLSRRDDALCPPGYVMQLRASRRNARYVARRAPPLVKKA